MPAKKLESKEATKSKRKEKMFTFDEFKAKYSPDEPDSQAKDDPEDVAADLATESIAILRQGLGEGR